MATLPEPPAPRDIAGMSPPRFAELHAVSNFTFLRGASHPEELVRQAWTLGYAAIAITDECSLAGVVRAHVAARECAERDAEGGGIKLIVGAEFRLEALEVEGGETVHLVLLAPTRQAYGQLSELITRGRRRSPKGEYALGLDDLLPDDGGYPGVGDCLALWVPACAPIGGLLEEGRRLKALLPHLWIALEVFLEPSDLDRTANALTLSTRLGLPIVASNDVHMHVAGRKPLQDVVSAVRNRTTVAELGTGAHANRERYLRSPDCLAGLYPREMLAESVAIADRCSFSLDELRYEYPEELVPAGLTPGEHLRRLTFEGARERWPDGVPEDVVELIEKELALIRKLSYEYYFLTVHDIVRHARTLGILCQGRGSAANSAVCYCLRVTEVDPSRMHLLFERFVSAERDEPPDIDVDFEHERREEVIQYIYGRYGRDRAALAATLITYRPRSAIRDVGGALGLDAGLLDALAKSMAWWDGRDAVDARLRACGLDPDSRVARQFLFLVNEILGFPRHLSQHVGGFVISKGPLPRLVPIENAAMEDRTVIQWDKDDLESLGLLKVDVLGLGMLTAIRKTLDLVNGISLRHREGRRGSGSELTVAGIPAEDPHTYAMLQNADSVGVFQVESRAQMSMLPRLKPENFYDLVIEVAIVRPGPIQGNMVHPYLRRRQGLEPVSYSSEGVRRVLERTLGVPIFQEQVIELAMVAAGFSGGEADRLRRAMAAWKRARGTRGLRAETHRRHARTRPRPRVRRAHLQADPGLRRIRFPGVPRGEFRAAGLRLRVAQAARAERLLLRAAEQPADGLLHAVAATAGRRGARPRGARSRRAEERLGLSPGSSRSRPRTEGPPAVPGARDCAAGHPRRPAPDQGPLRGSGGTDRRRPAVRGCRRPRRPGGALRAGPRLPRPRGRPQAPGGTPSPGTLGRRGRGQPERDLARRRAHAPYRTRARLKRPGAGDDLIADYRYLGLTLGPHPMSLLREDPALRDCRTAADLLECRPNQFVRVAGIVTCRQRPGSATGVVFMTLEDETGNSNIIVWNAVLTRYRAELLQGRLLAIKGVVEREQSVIHVVAGEVRDLTDRLAGLSHRVDAMESFASRNFR